MKNSIKRELKEYIKDSIEDYTSSDCTPDKDDLHFRLFNEDYYIIGYHKAQCWLDEHNISVFEALETIRDYEELHFGECKQYTNAEETVNMLVYIYGEELLAEMEFQKKQKKLFLNG